MAPDLQVTGSFHQPTILSRCLLKTEGIATIFSISISISHYLIQMLIKLLQLFQKKLTLAVIFVEYDRQKCGGSDTVFKTLQDYLGNIQGCRTTYLRVDNKNEAEKIKKISKDIYTVRGDNTFRGDLRFIQNKGEKYFERVTTHSKTCEIGSALQWLSLTEVKLSLWVISMTFRLSLVKEGMLS